MNKHPLPPVDLTGYLTALANRVGYRVDLDELDPACGLRPDLVVPWAVAGARHAALAFTRHLLHRPTRFMREQVATEAPETARLYVAMLEHLYTFDEALETSLARTERDYTTACRLLARSETGLTQPHTADTRRRVTPTGTRTTPNRLR